MFSSSATFVIHRKDIHMDEEMLKNTLNWVVDKLKEIINALDNTA